MDSEAISPSIASAIREQTKVLTFTFVGIANGRSRPRSIEEERFALFAVTTGRVVLARALQLSILVLHATRCVAVAFASTADREVAERISAGASCEQ